MNTITLAPGLTLIHGDCMEHLATLPDGAFDLAVVDPPYGIGESLKVKSRPLFARQKNGRLLPVRGARKHAVKQWDTARPQPEYFAELLRASRDQIVWGGNHFADLLPPSSGWIVWDKVNKQSDQSDCELAWTSFNRGVRQIEYMWNGFNQGVSLLDGRRSRGDKSLNEERIQPCQKPELLYHWLLQNYAKPGQTILDTHLGSGSSAIAAWEMGYTFTGIEIDKEYFNAAVERISKRLAQPFLPGIAGNEGKGQAEQVKLFCD